MTNLNTTDKPKLSDHVKENKSSENDEPVDSDLTIKRKRLVRQEATTQYLDDKAEEEEDKCKDENIVPKATGKAVSIKRRSDDKLTDCGVKNKRSVRQVECVTTREAKVSDEPKRKSSTSQAKYESLSRHSSGRTGSLSSQTCGNTRACPTYSLDMDKQGDDTIWKLQGGSQSSPGLQNQDHPEGQEKYSFSTIDKRVHKTTKQEWNTKPNSSCRPGYLGITEQSCHNEVMSVSGSIRRQQKQGNMTGTSQRGKHKEPNDPQIGASQGRKQQGQHSSTGDLISQGQRNPHEELNESVSAGSISDYTKPINAGYKRLQHNLESSPLSILGQGMDHRVGQDGIAIQRTNNPMYKNHTSHDNLSYQTIPQEFLTRSTRLEKNQMPKSREKQSSEEDPDPDMATPNCILLAVGLLLVIIVITMMLFMDSLDDENSQNQ